MTPLLGGRARGAAGAPSIRARLLLQALHFGLRDGVVPANPLTANLANVNEMPQPFGAVASLPGSLSNQNQFLVLHGGDDIASRQYRTTIGLALLAFTNYNIGEGQYFGGQP